MVIRAANGKEYDLNNLTQEESGILVLLGHLKNTPTQQEPTRQIFDDEDKADSLPNSAKKPKKR
jgi:hypothetical protein